MSPTLSRTATTSSPPRPRPGRAAAIFVDIVAIMIDEGELLARRDGGRRCNSRRHRPGSRRRRSAAPSGLLAAERQGARAAVDAALAAGTGSGTNRAGRAGARRPRHGRCGRARAAPPPRRARRWWRSARPTRPPRSTGIGAIAMPPCAVERLGREPGPDHEAVGRRIAGGDAEAERIAAPDRCARRMAGAAKAVAAAPAMKWRRVNMKGN